MEDHWKFTEADPKWTGEHEPSFRVALIDELDQLNKTLSVIASNQERQVGQVDGNKITLAINKELKNQFNLAAGESKTGKRVHHLSGV